MRYTAFCVLLLTISEPLLSHANKVVLVLPQQTRRSIGPVHGASWRPLSPRFRKSSHSGDVQYHRYHGPPSGHYHSKKPVYSKTPYAHGGDDFDRGYQQVNNVKIPYGKGISHAISYGKGYIPYDTIKDSLPFGRERFPNIQEHENPEPDYSATSFASPNSDYPPTGHSYESTQPDTFFTDTEGALNYNERRNDQKKYYTSRSIEKGLGANSPLNLAASTSKDQLFLLQQKPAGLYNSIIHQPQTTIVVPSGVQSGVPSGVQSSIPSGIPSATIGGSKEGLVLRDSVALDEYQQKVQEMTRTWPQFLTNTSPSLANNFQNQQLSAGYTTDVSPSNSFTGSLTWPFNFAQPKQGYDVKEDTMEPPHDFRTMPIQTSPYHSFSVPMNVAVPGVSQAARG